MDEPNYKLTDGEGQVIGEIGAGDGGELVIEHSSGQEVTIDEDGLTAEGLVDSPHGSSDHDEEVLHDGEEFDLGPDDGELGRIGGGGNNDMWWWVRDNPSWGNRMGFVSSDGLLFETISYDMIFAVGADEGDDTFGTGEELLRISDDGYVEIEGRRIEKDGSDENGVINFKTA